MKKLLIIFSIFLFTSSAEASKPNRAYVAVLRLFIDHKENMISITNPIYFGRAFTQDKYNNQLFTEQFDAINRVLNIT